MPKTKSQLQAEDVAALLRARNSLLWVVSKEEARVERYLVEAAAAAGYIPRTWDVGQGVADMAGNVQADIGSVDPEATLNAIRERTDRGLWIMRDMAPWLQGPIGLKTVRMLRNLARFLPTAPRDRAQALVILTPSAEIPPELTNHATVIEWPMPDREEIAAIFDASIEALPDNVKGNAAPNGTRDSAIDAAVGLSGEEASACYARSLVQLRKIDPITVAKEKRRVIARERVLEWYDPLPGGLDSVGGLENLKVWLKSRGLAYTPEARAYGIVPPRGVLIAGVSGTGKSYIAKGIATAWGVPLLKMDLGALKSKYVGESEAQLRKAFNVIATIGRCVILLDEIEKSLQGATSESADGGVSSDALGALLTWMQERQGEAFIVATSNSIDKLPPEFLRKGRFDEIFWTDLPTETERIDIMMAALATHGRKEAQDIDYPPIAEATIGFTGAEIAALVPDALFTAYADSARAIRTDDLLRAAKGIVPLSKTAKEKIDKMRDWAKGRARMASASEITRDDAKAPVRELDIV